jgi:hypothetical protein
MFGGLGAKAFFRIFFRPLTSVFLFFCKKAFKKNFQSYGNQNSSASTQGQAPYTVKILGRCNFCGGCNYNI